MTYELNSNSNKFGIMSTSTWEAFQAKTCARLAIDPAQAKLMCRLIDCGYVGTLTPLNGEEDWTSTMATVCDALESSDAVQLEVLNQVVGSFSSLTETKPDVEQSKDQNSCKLTNLEQNVFKAAASQLLSNLSMDIKTYYFIYPSIASDLPKDLSGITTEEKDRIMLAGIECADDFSLLSPLNLCLSTHIAPEKIMALYTWAEEAINEVHAKEVGAIIEVEGWRREVKLLGNVGL